MTNYKNLPNELKQNIFDNIFNSTNSLNSLKELQKICMVSGQFKNYCNKYFVPEIKPIIETIVESLKSDSNTNYITIYTKQKFKKIMLNNKNGINLKIFTKFHSKKILQDIITNIETQNYFRYNIRVDDSSIFLRKTQREISVYIV